jgi:hypothetical protein
MYPEGQPFASLANQVGPEAFDALLFVEKTTAAREIQAETPKRP